MESKVTDPERLKQLAEEARFIESLLDLDGTNYNNNVSTIEIVNSHESSSETIEEDVDLVLDRYGSYISYNSDLVLIEHRGYYVDEDDVYYLHEQNIDEDAHRVIEVLTDVDCYISVSDDYEGLISIEDDIFFNKRSAILNGYEELTKDVWTKKIINNDINKDSLPFLKDIEDSINLFFPNNWWFQPTAYTFNSSTGRNANFKDYPYVLIIKFPNVNISNSQNLEHLIQELYVIVPFRQNGTTCSNIFGFRGKLTNIEVSSRYHHSHLPTMDNGGIGKFCLGSSPLLTMLGSLFNTFNKNLFSEFLANLAVYVEWESLEGGPHRRIGETVIKTNIKLSDKDTFPSLIKYIETALIKDFLDLVIEYDNNNKLLDINFKKFELSFSEYLKKTTGNTWRMCYKDNETNQYFDINTNTQNATSNFITPLCKLGEKDIFLEIENIENKNTNYIKVLHPNITNYGKKYLFRRINDYYIQKNKDRV